jgi:GrpB-like predicted nucleotidyltransferase (UPF0157 family)/adenylate kinase family enzyme
VQGEPLMHRIHVTGAPGCGVTTLGRALAAAIGGIALDSDDFYWTPTYPPFQFKRPVNQRLGLLHDALPQEGSWILSGAIDSWGGSLLPLFDLVVFLEASTEVRLARLRERERRRMGDDAVAPGGFFHKHHEEFIEWASNYESGVLPGRSLPRHEKWLATLPCPVLRLNSERAVQDLVASVLDYLVRPPKTIVVSDYNPDWPLWFEELRNSLWPSVADFALSIEHVGGTSVPGLAAKPVIDLDIVIPSLDYLPLAIERLDGLGYVHRGDLGIQGRAAFREPSGSRKHHLYVCPADSLALGNHLSFRNHLRRNSEAARAYAELKKKLALEFAQDIDVYTEKKTQFVLTILGEEGLSEKSLQEICEASFPGIAFEAPRRLKFLMAAFSRPWYVAGGWALDLFLETKTRHHADIEMLIFREDQLALQLHLFSLPNSFVLTKIVPRNGGGLEEPWLAGESVDLSIHQMRARSADFEFDILIGDTDGDRWVYRRDPRVIRSRVRLGLSSALGIPFLAPEIVLLFKAKMLLQKDWDDFAKATPGLSTEAKRWLKEALTVAHPHCPWIEQC